MALSPIPNGTPVTQAANTDTSQAVTGSTNEVSTGDLPWASVLLPTTSSGQSGSGENKHGLLPESWVFGFFADGDNCQQPVVVGVIAGVGSGVGGGAAGGGSTTTGDGTGSGGGSSGGGGDTGGGSTGGGTSVEPGQRAEYAYHFFTGKGYTPEQAAGMVGGLMGESGQNLNPTARNPSSGAYGIGQWLGPRKRAITARYGTSTPTFEQQLNFLIEELETTEGTAKRNIKNSHDPESAAAAWCTFERPEAYNAKTGHCRPTKYLRDNQANARRVYEKMKGKQDLGKGGPISGGGGSSGGGGASGSF